MDADPKAIKSGTTPSGVPCCAGLEELEAALQVLIRHAGRDGGYACGKQGVLALPFPFLSWLSGKLFGLITVQRRDFPQRSVRPYPLPFAVDAVRDLASLAAAFLAMRSRESMPNDEIDSRPHRPFHHIPDFVFRPLELHARREVLPERSALTAH